MNKHVDQFRLRFREEANDHINDLEKALLELEKDPSQKDFVEGIFRALHSLKGGGGMFGFEKLSEFTHDLENIYDLIRKGQLGVTGPLISITLESVDLLRRLLDDKVSDLEETTYYYKSIQHKVHTVVGHASQKGLSELEMQVQANSPFNTERISTATYFIHFSPDGEVLQNGNNPLYLLDELASLGSMLAFPGLKDVPDLQHLEPTSCYLFWDTILATTHSVKEISDVFIFVEAASQIAITQLADSDLLQNDDFVAQLKQLSQSEKVLSVASVKDLMAAIKPQNTGASTQTYMPSLRVSSEKVDSLMNLVSELVLSQDRLGLIANQNDIPELKLVADTIQELTAQLRSSTFSISLLPISSLTTRFKRLVRDISKDLEKEVIFLSSGEETELDKSMIENITDPLLHIMRNCIDHGIEKPEEREMAGKPRVGRISLNAYYSGNNVVIEVADDGRGLNLEDIRKKALARGIIDKNANLSDQEIYDLVFLPGFSTCDTVSDLSGRGVGLDVVKKNIATIKGSVKIDANPGHGTSISIRLPMVLSIIDGLLVSIGSQKYVLPLSMIKRIFSVSKKDVERVFNNIIPLEGIQYPFFDLRNCLSIKGNLPERMQAILININGQEVLFSLDQVEGKIQAVLKPLGRFFQDNNYLSAATILADGSIALVLDPNAIINEY
jgi:two-component system chemotaxis sensor kinase CheA